MRRPIGSAFSGEKPVKDCTVFAPPTEEEVWQHIRLRYARGTRHEIVEAPGYPGLVEREALADRLAAADYHHTNESLPEVQLRPTPA